VPWTHGTYDDELAYADTYAAEKRAEAKPQVEQCKQTILEGIESEIRRLKLFLEKVFWVDSRRVKIEIFTCGVSDLSHLDRFLRYEASVKLRRSLRVQGIRSRLTLVTS
jgi:hypothetical protein